LQNQDIIKYVDKVMDKTDVPAESKTRIENELIRNIISASDNPDINIMDVLCSPEKLAEELTRKFRTGYPADAADYGRHEEPQYYHHPPRRNSGELMIEHNNLNLKLLYIPLLQISSGTERLTSPLD
jgi:hypothetical protein